MIPGSPLRLPTTCIFSCLSPADKRRLGSVFLFTFPHSFSLVLFSAFLSSPYISHAGDRCVSFPPSFSLSFLFDRGGGPHAHAQSGSVPYAAGGLLSRVGFCLLVTSYICFYSYGMLPQLDSWGDSTTPRLLILGEGHTEKGCETGLSLCCRPPPMQHHNPATDGMGCTLILCLMPPRPEECVTTLSKNPSL